MAGLEQLNINSGCRVSNAFSDLGPGSSQSPNGILLFRKKQLLNTICFCYNYFSVIASGFFIGEGRARALVDSFVLVFSCSNSQYF